MAKKTVFWQGWLVDNPLTEDPNDFTLNVMKSGKMVTTADIARELVAEGTEFKLETIIDILDRGDRIVRNKLLGGYSIGTGVYYAYPSVSGVWYSASETFDDERHKVGVNFQLAATLRDSLKSVGVEVLGISEAGPSVTLVTDLWTKEMNGVVSPGEDLSVKGRNLRVEGEKEGNGICFVRVDDGVATKVDVRRLTINNPSQLQFRVPELAPGDYWLEVTTQYSSGSARTKEPRTVRFGKVLNVAAETPEQS